MSINDMLTRKEFKRMQEQFLASVRVAEENNRKGVVFKNGTAPMPEGRRALIDALLDEKFQAHHKFKGEK